MAYLRNAALAAALLAGSGAAKAQTTIITQEPAPPRAVITTEQQLQLTPVQRQTIYRTIVRDRVAASPPAVEYRVGTRVPSSVQLYAVPEAVAVEVPVVRRYKYMIVNDQVVLVDPATSQVVAEIVD